VELEREKRAKLEAEMAAAAAAAAEEVALSRSQISVRNSTVENESIPDLSTEKNAEVHSDM